MTRMKITKTSLKKLRAPHPSGKPELIWDQEMRGFGVRISGTTNARSYVVQRDLPGGKTRRVTIGPVDENVMPLAEARKRAGAVLRDLIDGIDPKVKLQTTKADSYSFREALEEHIDTQMRRGKLRPVTAGNYRWQAQRYLGDWLDRPLKDITREMVLARHNKLAQDVANRKINEMATGANTANGAMRVLRAAYNHAKALYPDLPENPVVVLRKRWFETKPRTDHLKAVEDDQGEFMVNQLADFYNAVTDPKVVPNGFQRDCLLFMLFTGMRSGEASGLRWSEVNFPERIILLPASRTKARRDFVTPMTDFVFDLLMALRAIAFSDLYVFSSSAKVGHVVNLKHPIGLVREATGIYITPHGLRRTYATVAESCNIPHYALKALCNHASNDITRQYVQMKPDRLREPAQRVTDELKRLCGVKELGGKTVTQIRGLDTLSGRSCERPGTKLYLTPPRGR